MTSAPLPKPTPFPGNLRSPCVSICRMDVDSGYCEGCFRTIEEIADWGMMSDDRKRGVWQALRHRQAALRPAVPVETDCAGSAPAGSIPTTAPPSDLPLEPLPDARHQAALQPPPLAPATAIGFVSQSRHARR